MLKYKKNKNKNKCKRSKLKKYYCSFFIETAQDQILEATTIEKIDHKYLQTTAKETIQTTVIGFIRTTDFETTQRTDHEMKIYNNRYRENFKPSHQIKFIDNNQIDRTIIIELADLNINGK